MYSNGPWVCLKCNAPNQEKLWRCNKCQASRFWNGHDAKIIRHEGEEYYVKIPTIWRLDEVRFSKKSHYLLTKCPSCDLLMVLRDKACPHCKCVLTKQQMAAQEPLNVFGVGYYIKSVLLALLALAILVYVFS